LPLPSYRHSIISSGFTRPLCSMKLDDPQNCFSFRVQMSHLLYCVSPIIMCPSAVIFICHQCFYVTEKTHARG
jgi:hypothetical protein